MLFGNLEHERNMAEIVLKRLDDSDWGRVLDDFDELKLPNGRLHGWTKNELARLLEMTKRAYLQREIDKIGRKETFYLSEINRLIAMLSGCGLTPKDFGGTKRALANARAATLRKDVAGKLKEIDDSLQKAGYYGKPFAIHLAIDLIKFLKTERCKLARFTDAKAFWAKIERACNVCLAPETMKATLKGGEKSGKARLLCNVLELESAGYVTLEAVDRESLLASIKQCNKYARLDRLPKV